MISNISLEFITVTNPSLAAFYTVEFLDPILLHKDSDTCFTVDINSPLKSLKGVCYSYLQKKEVPLNLNKILKNFTTPKVTKVEVTVEGSPNELYAQNMEYHHQYDEIRKHFGEGWLKDASVIQKEQQLHDVDITSYYTDKYALWLDF